MTTGRRRWVMAIVLAAVVGVGWFLWPRARPATPEPAIVPEEEVAGAEFRQARIVGRRRGERQWVVDAQRLREETDERVRVEQIDSGTLYRNQEPYLEVTAAEAVADQDTNNLVLSGGVTLVRTDGTVLQTERLEWFADDERLVAPGSVVVEREGERVRADRMEIRWDEDILSFYDHVRLDRDDGHWLRADRVDYDMETEDVTVRGPFRAAVPPRGEEGDNEGDNGDDGT